MRYISTRNSDLCVTDAQAIARGISPDGGLFVPETFSQLTGELISAPMPYKDRAAQVMGQFLSGFDETELHRYAAMAYSEPGFDHPEIAPVRKLKRDTHFLELWHGPTCAFKDMALQILPHLLTASLKKTGEQRCVCILVATSGDTGKAALEGFCDVEGTKIMVFYPRSGVSDVQKLQMITQRGSNVNVCSVEGNFDDAQTGVKAIFSDAALSGLLDSRGYFLSSANSINWGRLVPQIVYYVSAYSELVKKGEISTGDKINFVVPTGNFGNILAGYYAYMMGLPIAKLICASNRNDVLTDFITSGVYSADRAFYTTVSPSMDILVSSNLERLLFELSGKNSAEISEYMSQLKNTGRYEVSKKIKAAMGELFYGARCGEEETKRAVADVFSQYGYLIDTHTAVAYKALCDYRDSTGDGTTAVVVSTASPFKFCDSVLEALGKPNEGDGAKLIEALSSVSGASVPAPLRNLHGLQPRFSGSVSTAGMADAVTSFLP